MQPALTQRHGHNIGLLPEQRMHMLIHPSHRRLITCCRQGHIIFPFELQGPSPAVSLQLLPVAHCLYKCSQMVQFHIRVTQETLSRASAACFSACGSCCFHSEAQRMPYPLPSTQYSHNLRIRTATLECCLLVPAQHTLEADGKT